MTRKLFVIYTFSVIIFSLLIFIGISYRKNKFFNEKELNKLIYSTSDFRTKYKSPCDNVIRGDPDVADNWVKINFHCPDGIKNSTLTTIVFDKQISWRQIMSEFSRILGFETNNLIGSSNWKCFINREIELKDKPVNNWDKEVFKKDSIDCIDGKYDLNYLINYYEQK